MTQSVAMCKNTSDIEISESVITGYTSESDGEYVLGRFKYVGGIVGIVADYKPYRSVRYSGFTGCVNYGSITDNMSTSVSAYLTCVGGVAGAMYGGGDNKRSEYRGSTSASTYYNIKHKIICYSANHGNITLKHHYYNSTNGDPEYIGGVIGRANTDNTGIEITYCYNTGVISASTGSYIGCLIGSYWRMYSTISYCFNVGRVVGSSTYKALIGQIGFTSNNTYTKNFYQEGVSNGNKDDTSVATEKTMDEMSSTSTLSTLGYSTTYMANSTTAGYYPCLNSNYAKGDTHIEATTSDAFEKVSDGYIIETAKHLEILADKVNNNRSGSLGQYSKQTYYVVANINCGNNYIPIGSSENTPFMGTFKGVASRTSLTTVQTRTIAMYGYSSSYSGGAYGLFGYTNGAYISYITRGADLYAGSNTTGKSYVGGIVGKAHNTALYKCNNLADIKGVDYVGGLAGYKSDRYFEKCENSGSITATGNYVGGIVGYTEKGRIQYGNKTGGVVTGNTYVGGIAGYAKGTDIDKCSATSGSITGKLDVGGLVGRLYDGSIAGTESSSSINNQAVSGYSRVGGIVGSADSTISDKITIAYVSNTGTITCLGTDSCQPVGGFNITHKRMWESNKTHTTISATTSKLAAIGGIAGFCSTSINKATSSGDVLIDINNAPMSINYTEGSYFWSSTPYVIDLNNILVGFGGLVSVFTGTQVIFNSSLNGSLKVGSTDVSATKGIACVGGFVGYMGDSTIINVTASLGQLTIRGAFFAGAIVGCCNALTTTAVVRNYYYNGTLIGSDTITTSCIAIKANITSMQNIDFKVNNPVYNSGTGYDNDGDWRDMGGCGGKNSGGTYDNTINWLTNDPRVGCFTIYHYNLSGAYFNETYITDTPYSFNDEYTSRNLNLTIYLMYDVTFNNTTWYRISREANKSENEMEHS